LSLEREFDLVISLEVANQLPEEGADLFVDTLTSLGPVALFSATIPHQSGDSHLNSQWPRYWIDRFGARGWEVTDSLRARIWDNPHVAHRYAQNALLFTRSDWSADRPQETRPSEPGDFGGLPVVHPKTLVHLAQLADSRLSLPEFSPRELVRMLPSALRRAVRNRLK
jgi:hypothetical protein